MTNSLLIGKVIYKLLSNLELVDKNNVYPLIADNDTKYPFIVYKRLSITSGGCKDGYYEDQLEYEITIVSTTYAESIDIANEVRRILEKKKIETDLMTIYDNKITNITEEFNDVYVQTLIFTCKVN